MTIDSCSTTCTSKQACMCASSMSVEKASKVCMTNTYRGSVVQYTVSGPASCESRTMLLRNPSSATSRVVKDPEETPLLHRTTRSPKSSDQISICHERGHANVMQCVHTAHYHLMVYHGRTKGASSTAWTCINVAANKCGRGMACLVTVPKQLPPAGVDAWQQRSSYFGA